MKLEVNEVLLHSEDACTHTRALRQMQQMRDVVYPTFINAKIVRFWPLPKRVIGASSMIG